MTERPFDAVRRALHDISHELNSDSQPTRLDPRREARTGIPEFIFARSKPAAEVVASLAALARQTGRAIATRCPEMTLTAVQGDLAGDFDVLIQNEASAVVVAARGSTPPQKGGRVAVITAGSSDAPVAAEAAFIAREMGATVYEVRDVGVAGLHRLVEPLERVVEQGVDAIVVVAGMDGALPSVVTGLVAVPVIGVPTSTGYGFGGEGTAALMTMLQSCAPGLVVVNIDNGVGAGATAALIANRAAGARVAPPEPQPD
ncbi:MAG: pyridinium-3,5-biscarboxylic acid mononucleotide synthase [Thermomicrobiales bacterium]|jgi:NCAIR mutase (PurE)-related protein|nr:pyridinium-3,5-biscarboxylic acid mononucleotide synthase [Thermomicrobiales bacterium]